MAVMTMAARVLLVDDTPDIRALLRLVLSRQDDFEVVAEAADGSEAIDMAREHRPDIVLLDLAMPVMDGLEAIPGVRAAVPDCKIIVLSGFNADQMAAEAMSAGADAYIEKGTPPLRLVSELRRICGLREAAPPERPDVRPLDIVSAGDGAGTPWGRDHLALVTHEIMSPLAVIEGFASLLERKPHLFDHHQVREHAASISRSARQLRSLLEAITDARRVEESALTLDRARVDLVALTQELVQDMATITAGHRVHVRCDGPIDVTLDAVRIRQVVSNLMTNAVKFSPRDGVIEVTVQADERWAEVVVRDQGPGIPHERRAQVFRRFGRLDTAVKGMGLGLYISRGLARAHGGDLVLLDEGPPGAAFALRLPRH
ncbi:MAG: response regulator [Actinobacteria bacterium]|nr:response regulator [Actinomycetota bacterium]